MYVTAQALLPQHVCGPHGRITAYLYACYEKVTFRGIKPFSKQEMEPIFHKNLKGKEGVKNHLVESGFTVSAGYFKEQ